MVRTYKNEEGDSVKRGGDVFYCLECKADILYFKY